MKKFFAFAIIIVSAVYSYFALQLSGDLNSQFNTTTRYDLGKYSILRWAFNLHNDGDARKIYALGDTPLVVEIVAPHSVELTGETLGLLETQLGNFLGRQIEIFNVDFVEEGKLSKNQLAEIVKGKRRHQLPEQPNFFVIMADDFEGRGSEVAMTYKEFGMVMSLNRVKEITKGYVVSLPQYYATTMMHELGHQLGLPHVKDENCIMSEIVNHPDASGYFSGRYTPVEFCPEEKALFAELKKQLQ